ncbi:MAG: hypothetical protein RBR22_13855 [Desulfuromonas sp.]|nr:hypothetical protein [Desulfuromonas sp.]
MTTKNKIIVDAEISDNLKKHCNILNKSTGRRATALAKRREIKERQAAIRTVQAELEKNLKNTATDLSKSLMSGGDLSVKSQTAAREQLDEYKQELSLLDETDRKLLDEVLSLPELDLCQWNLDNARALYLNSAARSALTNQQQDEALASACVLAYATSGNAVMKCLAECFDAEAVQIAQANIKHKLVEASGVGEYFA